MNKKNLNDIVQQFYDDSENDEVLQVLINKYTEVQIATGISDPVVLLQIFEYLDEKLKKRIKTNIKERFDNEQDSNTSER